MYYWNNIKFILTQLTPDILCHVFIHTSFSSSQVTFCSTQKITVSSGAVFPSAPASVHTAWRTWSVARGTNSLWRPRMQWDQGASVRSLKLRLMEKVRSTCLFSNLSIFIIIIILTSINSSATTLGIVGQKRVLLKYIIYNIQQVLCHTYPKLAVLVISNMFFNVTAMINAPVCASSLMKIFLMLKYNCWCFLWFFSILQKSRKIRSHDQLKFIYL